MIDSILNFLAEYGVWGLFLASFLSATIIPLASEVVLIAVVAAGINPITAIFMATLGNSLGGFTNYFIGRIFNAQKALKLMGVSQQRADKVLPYAKKHGIWLAWLGFSPLFGETILIVLGMLKANFWYIAVFSTLGKLARYAVIIFVQLKITG